MLYSSYMVAANPATQAVEISEELAVIIRAGGPYADPKEFSWRSLKRRAERVRDVDAVAGWGLLALLYAIAGDVEEMERCFRAADALAPNDRVNTNNWIVMRTNLGRNSAALELALKHATVESGFFSERFGPLVRAGGIHAAAERIKRAREIGLDVQGLGFADLPQAAKILAEAGIEDQAIARQLDVAGRLLAETGQLHIGETIVDVNDEPGVYVGVTYVLRVGMSNEAVFNMNVALANAEQEAGIERHPAFDVSFAAA